MNTPNRIAVAISLLAAVPCTAAAAVRNEGYERYIGEARAGQTGPALAYLEQRLAANPNDRRALYDYIVILGWAERHGDAFALRDRLNLRATPLYVITSLAGSARKAGELEESKRLYRVVLERDSSRIDAVVGLALALADTGYPEPALISLQRRMSDALPIKDKRALLRAEADIHAARGDHASAADVLQRLTALDPDDTSAKRDLAVVTNRMGAAPLAMEQLESIPDATRLPEWPDIALARGAMLIRWGTVDNTSSDPALRFAAADRALNENTRIIETLSRSDPPRPDALRRARFDRVLALRNRLRMREAASLYEALGEKYGAQIPPYVRVAAADAYLYLEQPQRARDLYLQARQESGEEDEAASLGLFYSYVECEQFDEAYALIGQLAERARKFDPTFRPAAVNPAHLRLRIVQAMSRSYGGQQAEAGAMLDDLQRAAPFNSELRANRARWMAARGWLRQARDEFIMLRSEDPNYPAAAVGIADTQLALNEYRSAEAGIAALTQDYPEDKGVQDLQRLWQLHNMRELTVESSFGRGSGAVVGNRDHSVETFLYSAPFAYNYRAFARAYDAEADFDGGTAYRRRLGAGLEYRDRDYTIMGAVSAGIKDDTDAAIDLGLEWRPDDYWTAKATASTSADNIPLRARSQGVTARGAEGQIVYRWHESSQVRAGLGIQDFSDDNMRRTWNLGYLQRLVATPRYKLDIDVAASGSSNSEVPTALYFNPRRDQSLDLTFINEWLVTRHYSDSVVNRLMVSAGDYAQRGFGSGMSWDVRAEQQREWDRRLSLRYGIGRSSHPYDGIDEKRNYVYLNLGWRF